MTCTHVMLNFIIMSTTQHNVNYYIFFNLNIIITSINSLLNTQSHAEKMLVRFMGQIEASSCHMSGQEV